MKILLVEDNPVDVLLLRSILGDVDDFPHELVHTELLNEALKQLQEAHFDVVLLDLSLPDGDGLETLHSVLAAAPHVPTIVLTGADDGALSVKAVHSGAQDYLIKGEIGGRTLARVLCYAVERQRTQQEKRRLSDILEATTDFVGLADRNGGVLYLNAAGRKMVGIGTDEDVSSMSIADYHPRWLIERIQDEAFATAVREGTWMGEGAILTRGGKEIPASIVLIAHRGLNKSVVEYFSLIARDLSEQVQAREDLRRVIAGARCLLWRAQVERRGDQFYWQTRVVHERAAQRFLPLTLSPGQTYADAWHASKLPADQQDMNERTTSALLDGERSYTREFQCIDANHQLHWLHEDVFIEPVGTARWELVGVCTDITQQKNAEAELVNYSKNLEEMVSRRTTELESANRAKSEFLANMSHELRSPLNAIIGFTEVLLERYFGPLNEKQAEYVTDILTSGEHLLALINDILDLSKVEAGKEELRRAEVSLQTLLENSLTLIREKAANHDITLELDLAPNVGIIAADERKLKQVVYNLLSNAVKFTPDGGVIRLEAASCSSLDVLSENHACEPARDEPHEWVQISVQDTGIGIPTEEQAYIFDAFYQVAHHTADKPAGTGLGLSLSQHLVEMHGGYIWVESDGPDAGTRFSFVIPKDTEAGSVHCIIATEAALLRRLNHAIRLSQEKEDSFTLCRMFTNPTCLGEKGVRVAEILEGSKRKDDSLIMNPGANYFLVLRHTSKKNAYAACDRLKKRIEAQVAQLSVEWAMATFPQDGKSAKALIKKVREAGIRD